MKLIIGLGNPGEKYTQTRHNIGFQVLDYIADLDNDIHFSFDKKSNAETTRCIIEGHTCILAKPQTFMNNSGDAVQKLASYFDISSDECIIVYDEIDLPFGEIRTTGKSAGGHKGMQSIITHLGTKAIKRVRIGIRNEQSDSQDTAHFVLNNFSKEEKALIEQQLFSDAFRLIKKLVSED